MRGQLLSLITIAATANANLLGWTRGEARPSKWPQVTYYENSEISMTGFQWDSVN